MSQVLNDAFNGLENVLNDYSCIAVMCSLSEIAVGIKCNNNC